MISAEAKRLRIIYEDCKKSGTVKNTTDFAKILDIDQSHFSRILNGIKPMNYTVMWNVCYKLGYSANWLLNGEGNKKQEKESVKLVTEISMLRTELEIVNSRLRRVEVRTGIDGTQKITP